MLSSKYIKTIGFTVKYQEGVSKYATIMF
jgi:hypothetical protein